MDVGALLRLNTTFAVGKNGVRCWRKGTICLRTLEDT